MPDNQKDIINKLPKIDSPIVSATVVSPWKISPCKIPRIEESDRKTEEEGSGSKLVRHSLDWEYGSEIIAKGRFYLNPTYIDCECFPLALLLPANEVALIQKCYEVLKILRNIDPEKERQLSEDSFYRSFYRKNKKDSKFPLLQSVHHLVKYGPLKTWDSLEKHLHQLARNYEELAKNLAQPPLLGAELTGILIDNQGRTYGEDFYRLFESGNYVSKTSLHIRAADGLLSRMLPRNG